ncbi:hypothetical protein BLSTO_04168 [Blastocystis sp. subtype 1]
MCAGDLLGQYISPHASSIDYTRSFIVCMSGFFITGPLSYTYGRVIHYLYPGYGRLSILKRIAITNCISPLTIACGIAPSTYVKTRDWEKTRFAIVNRVPASWCMSLLLMSPFTYVHSRTVVTRFHNLARYSYHMMYHSLLTCKNLRRFEENLIVELLL